jgi:NAD(P)-dependent dehydrogenase (short-subunit alcohol dehydrogenase family)
MRFEGKVALVTGGAAGIGAGCVRVFAHEGARVAIIDVDAGRGQILADEMNESRPESALFVPCDVSVPNQVERAVEATVLAFGGLNTLINNAGIHPPARSIDETSIDELEQVLRVNFGSTFAFAKFAAPHLRRSRGTIVNISSMTAVLGQEKSAAYSASKGAQLSFTKALALELGRDGVRVNAILPSNVDTPLMRAWAATLDDPQSALQRVANLQVFGRMADPEEIGRVCLFLSTEDSSFITGQGIEVEGGASLDY